ncbi:MAG: FAD-dependent oxidoreductase [Alphaproteobacteria bacterium]|nr:FAD-dependent oxidoreductase [Alphaproteobacteria bacterium]
MMNTKKKITIIGAGSVGTNTALFLDKQGFDVTLLESTDDILEGAPQATFITHGDGFEYHKAGHQKTGEYCIDGAIAKQLLYPASAFQSGVCGPGNPIRFMISEDSLGKDGLTLDSFVANAEHMRSHFQKRFDAISEVRGADAAKRLLMRTPETFARALQPEEYAECAHIAGGYAGSSTGINMAHYYAFLKAALRASHVKPKFRQKIDSIEKNGDSYTITTSTGEQIESDYIILAAGHCIPEISNKLADAKISAEGTYYLNTMTFLKLPATTDKEKINQVSHINFTLQQDGGCMFACVVPPTETEEGLAVVYYPSEKGSQFARHIFDKSSHTPLPKEWDDYIKNGLPNNEPRVQAIMQQAEHLYPFLKDYAVVDKTICRTVFNAATQESDKGLDRRVRNIIGADVLTDDNRVVAYRSPKWTNAELVALMATDHAMQVLEGKELSKDSSRGFGPTNIDVESITGTLHFKDIKMQIEDALHYVRKHGLPERLVNPFSPEFAKSPQQTGIAPREGWAKSASE